MKISYNWLKEFVPMKYSPDELSKALTDCGLEVEHLSRWESLKGGLQGLVVGKVVTCERHPNADRLSKTTVDTGDGVVKQIVCGAPNVASGQTVVVALPGVTLYPLTGDPFEIRKSKIRGEVSEGMICAEDEIGLGASHEGILVLPDHLAAGTPVSDFFKVECDHIFEIGLTPNRADAASHLGVARDIMALMGRAGEVTLNLPEITPFSEGKEPGSIQVEIKDHTACMRYSGVEIKNVRVGPSSVRMQNRLRSIGLRPVNNIVDITNYVMHELGQPLHAFDADKIQGGKISVGPLAAGTKFKTLDDVERTLQGTELMIADEAGPLCIAGVFGGADSGVTEKTSRIFLESAFFHPVHVRKSARAHGLHTDSSFRFERGTDPEMTVFALQRAVRLISSLHDGITCSSIMDIYPQEITHRQIELTYSYLNRIIGYEIPRASVTNIIRNLGMKIMKDMDDILIVSVPPFKVDVTRTADIAEEVLRIHGYNNIALPKKISITPGPVSKPDPEEVMERCSSFLVNNGFREIITNSLTRISHLEVLPVGDGTEAVQLLNPLSADLALLRHQMLPTGLEALQYNLNRQQKDLRFFESGKTYRKSNGKYSEVRHLSLYFTGNATAEHWKVKQEPFDIYQIKAMLEQLLITSGIDTKQELMQKTEKTDVLDSAVAYYSGKSLLARAGKVSRSVLKSMDISQEVWHVDIQFDVLMQLIPVMEKTIPEPPKFPEVRRDLSMLLNKEVQYSELERLAFSTEPLLLRQVRLFDVYEGEKIEKGKKSYALSFILRDDASTLQEKKIDGIMEKLMMQFESKLGALIRKA